MKIQYYISSIATIELSQEEYDAIEAGKISERDFLSSINDTNSNRINFSDLQFDGHDLINPRKEKQVPVFAEAIDPEEFNIIGVAN